MPFGRLERTRPPQPMSDINMTPLIDVMLVLMVLFMLAAPLIASSLHLDLPTSDAATAPASAAAPLDMAIDAAGMLFLDGAPIEPAAFSARVSAAAKQNPEAEVQLRADRSVPYGKVAELIGTLQKAGLSRIGLVAEPGSR